MLAYHHSHQDLEIGHVVQPGAWGRRVLEEGTAHPWFEREQLLEGVRKSDFFHLPSRLTSLFVWPQLKRAMMVPDKPHVYLVEVQEPTEHFVADLLWIDVALPAADSEGARLEASRQYWSGHRYYGEDVVTDPDSREILATTPAKVVSSCLHSST